MKFFIDTAKVEDIRRANEMASLRTGTQPIAHFGREGIALDLVVLDVHKTGHRLHVEGEMTIHSELHSYIRSLGSPVQGIGLEIDALGTDA